MSVEEAPPLVQELLAAIARHLGMGRGRWRLELQFEDGRVREWWKHHERLSPARLEEAGDG